VSVWDLSNRRRQL